MPRRVTSGLRTNRRKRQFLSMPRGITLGLYSELKISVFLILLSMVVLGTNSQSAVFPKERSWIAELPHGRNVESQKLNDDTQSKLKALRDFAQQVSHQAAPAAQTRNITIMKERIGALAVGRWDDNSGAAIDSSFKDDGPDQLQYAMVALATVAGTIICGGAITVACCWQHRERGHLKSAKYQKQTQVGAEETNPYQGQGAKWLKTPV